MVIQNGLMARIVHAMLPGIAPVYLAMAFLRTIRGTLVETGDCHGCLTSDQEETAGLRKHTRTGRPCGDEAFVTERIIRDLLRKQCVGRKPKKK